MRVYDAPHSAQSARRMLPHVQSASVEQSYTTTNAWKTVLKATTLNLNQASPRTTSHVSNAVMLVMSAMDPATIHASNAQLVTIYLTTTNV